MEAMATAAGVRFTETGCGTDYLSTDKHQHRRIPRNADDHSSWCVARSEEAEAFCRSYNGGGHADRHGNLWYLERVGERLRTLGTADEKVALFQAPSVEFGDWHGHPRGHRGRDDYPDGPMLRQLKDSGVITNVEYRRVRNGDIP